MFRLIRWYNQNRKIFWSAVGVIALFIVALQLINTFVKNSNQKELELAQKNPIQNTTIPEQYNNIQMGSTSSSLSGTELSEENQTEIEVIDQFIEYCNNQDLESAYGLLTDECKQEMYPTIENFRISYYQSIFNNTRKNVVVENWINEIYKVDFNEDFLSTGKYSKENTIQDYITVVEKDDGYKLNINRYIGRQEIHQSAEDKNIQIEVEYTDIYMDYQYYKINVHNQSENTILLDDGINIKAMYIEDENGIQYSAYTHELNEGQLMVSPRETKELEIRYYSKYSSEKQIDKVVFSRMILDNDSYEIYQNKSLYRGYENFEIVI